MELAIQRLEGPRGTLLGGREDFREALAKGHSADLACVPVTNTRSS